jgi:hypothetical protein
MRSDVDARSLGPDPASETVAEKLRGLSSALPPPVGWHELGPRLLRARSVRFARRVAGIETPDRHPGRRRAAAAAVCAALLAILGVITSRQHSQGPAGEAPVRTGEPPSAPLDSATQDTLARAAAAERWLASRPESPAVVHVGSRLAVVGLENGIASLDDALNAARVLEGREARVRQLQLERAQLVDSLAQVRYAEILAEQTE